MFDIARVSLSAHSLLPNSVPVARILQLSAEPLDEDIATWMLAGNTTLVLVGRLAPEKNHAAVLAGLAQLRRGGADLRLLFLGTGPMKHELETLARQLGVLDAVFFAGHRSNPYPSILKADGLILPSTHEGQGLVLIEGMILGTPVAATDIPGPASVLTSPELGLLVPASEEGVLLALQSLAAGTVPSGNFDSLGYSQEALEAAQNVLGLRGVHSPCQPRSASTTDPLEEYCVVAHGNAEIGV